MVDFCRDSTKLKRALFCAHCSIGSLYEGDAFYRWNDEEIKLYLGERKKLYYRKNYREIEEDKLFPNANLMESEGGRRYEYKLVEMMFRCLLRKRGRRFIRLMEGE